MMVRDTPGRTIGPGVLFDESVNNAMFPLGVVLSPMTVTFCPSLNRGSEESATGAAGAAVWGGGATSGVVATAGGVAGATGAEAPLLGLVAACGAGADGATGAGDDGLGFMATCGGGVLSPKKGLNHSDSMSGSIET
ncbi:MAG: hypothetical protein EHM80_09000 [Nitrospiraceae bacterium]|nr:MAG: hypothetical protein EHM80_09000 [Nitrospiraceae bacterium]